VLLSFSVYSTQFKVTTARFVHVNMEQQFGDLHIGASDDTNKRICVDSMDAIGKTPLVYLNKVTKGLDAKIGKFLAN
jgi:hypothetical protein